MNAASAQSETTIAISGASGNLGGQVADLVLERVPPERVVLLSRTPEALAAYEERGASVRPGDFDEPEVLRESLAGCDRMLIISVDVIGRRVAQHGNAIDAAVAAGVGHIAYTSIVNPSDSNPAGATPDHRGTEELIRASGLAWTFLRNAIYADTLITGAPAAIATGRLLSNQGAGRSAFVARSDCAAAAAAVLTGEGHENKAYDITGPEAVSWPEIAAIYGELTGREVEVTLVDDAGFAAALVEHAGMPEPIAQFVASFGHATRRGFFAVASESFEQLTGRAPESVRELLGEHRDELGG